MGDAVRTGLEPMVLPVDGTRFRRVLDDASGYKELRIETRH